MMPKPSRIAVVTGGTSGIGLATARKLLAAGHRVAVFSHSAKTVTDATAVLSAEFGSGQVLGRVVDLSDPIAVANFFEELSSTWGDAEILVCNAGISPKGLAGPRRFEDIGLEEWNEVLAVNLTGTMLCCQAVVRGMRQAGFGRIILIGSLAGRTRPRIAGGAYAASKAALAGLMRTLVGPCGPFGITVNLVAPGRILTPLTGDPNTPANRDAVARIPSARLGTPEDIAAAVAFLASEEAGFVNGAILDINGGEYAPA
ncbi:3-oxoacyl-ACP reductase FabG [Rhizobium miluonense]|jgi:3-oxoacyl-[acyl-carrier protein] reductase|uniref:3-oxoacyl-[acyl-carrier protein] reductase n=1 Tax=Rhizobium miluonense TaxID=411945 RepID=A0ABU1SR23_9HYPH|nr:3-oxoacyl-[acyl-carrier protein] reductase [Rhizobium miluonense]